MPSLGNQTPTYSWCASYTRTQGKLSAALSDAYALPPHPWQRTILNDWLALDDDGRLLNSVCLLPVPRQNGKTGVCDPRETWGLIHRGEWILHTAHEFQTSQKAFDRLRAKFGMCKNDPKAKYPELNRLVSKYTTSANQMVLDLTNGGHIEFRTRGSGGDTGRGGTFDLIVVDEAQCYTEESDAALSPLNSAAPHGSPQTIYMGTVPDPAKPHKGEVFARLRNDAHSEPYEGMCIHEWAAPEVGDPKDVARWYEFNPSLGYQLLERALLKDARSMSADTFAREHLGYWSMLEVFARVIPERAWAACQTDCPPMAGVTCYGVKFSPDGKEVALSAALRPDEGPIHVEVVRVEDMGGGMQWLVDWLCERVPRAAQIAIDGQSNAQELNERLLSARVPKVAILRPSAGDVVAACSTLTTAVVEGKMTHFGQQALTDSATKSTRRKIGNRGGWGFDSTDEADATLVESAALAYWAARTTRRNPNRKAVVRC
jgi:hypothetical protein